MRIKLMESRNGFDLVCYMGTAERSTRLQYEVQTTAGGRTLSSFACDPGDDYSPDEVATMARASFVRLAGPA